MVSAFAYKIFAHPFPEPMRFARAFASAERLCGILLKKWRCAQSSNLQEEDAYTIGHHEHEMSSGLNRHQPHLIGGAHNTILPLAPDGHRAIIAICEIKAKLAMIDVMITPLF